MLPVLILLGVFALYPESPRAQTLWKADFSGRPEGAYGLEAAKADFGPFIQYAKVAAGRARIKMDPELGRKVLEVKYPKGCVGPDACGMQVRAVFPVKQAAWMRYRVRFETGFDWQKGGKLPGLCGGKCNTGCIDVTGADGWSARLMWHDNAKLVLERTDVRFRDASAVSLNQFYFSTFHGGDAPDWGPGSDSYASFADIAVTEGDPRIITSSLLSPPPPSRPSSPSRKEGTFQVTMDRGSLRISREGRERLRLTLTDPSGRALQVLDLAGSDRERLSRPLRPGLYLLRWESREGSGIRPVTLL